MVLHQPFTKLLSPTVDGHLSTLLDYRYLIIPDNRISDTISSPITVMMTSLYLPDNVDNITFYDGSSIRDPVIESLTGVTVPNHWVRSTAPEMLIVVRTDSLNTNGEFEFLYHSDGESTVCSPTTPYVIEPMTGKFTDGTASFGTERVGTCTWLIKPKNNPEKIILYFNRIGIKNFASIQIYDGGVADSGSLLWSCDGCGFTAPPVLTSLKGQFLFRYVSTPAPGPGFYGFEAEYYSVLNGGYGSGDRTMDLLMASDNNIEAPRHNGYFPPNFYFKWNIAPNELNR